MIQPDDIDWEIINSLRNDYKSNNAIARELGVSEGMIRQRIRRLKENNVLKIKALINPEVLVDQQLAMIAANVDNSQLIKSKAKEICALDDVLSVSIATGRYDLLIEIIVKSNHGLVEFITDKFSKIEGVTNTESFLMLKSYKKYV